MAFDKNESDGQDGKIIAFIQFADKLKRQKVTNENCNYFPKGEVVGAPKLKAPGTVAWAN